MGEHRVEHRALDVDAVAAEYFVIVLDVLSDLQDVLVLIERLEYVDASLRFFMVGWDGNIVGLAFLYSKAQTDQFGRYRIG